ncbi:hypothetical protein M8J77_013902 [Diaphorina citri]|nr:hypothetical protein M8J77_013902 [Diaphorina citri]
MPPENVLKKLLCVSCHAADANHTAYDETIGLVKNHRIHLRWTKRMDSYHESTESLLTADSLSPKSDDGTVETRLTTDHDHYMDEIKIENMSHIRGHWRFEDETLCSILAFSDMWLIYDVLRRLQYI